MCPLPVVFCVFGVDTPNYNQLAIPIVITLLSK
jgi:hypothetical protein